ncbi:MAG: hypothetical protein V3U97_02675, partial [bacterium]
MVCTTTLSSDQQNQETSDLELNELVISARNYTGKNWQAVERIYTQRRWFRADKVTRRFELLVEVGGVLPFQTFICITTANEAKC